MPFFELVVRTEVTEVTFQADELNPMKKAPMPSPDGVPIFLLPAFGNAEDLYLLAWEIRQQNPDSKRPIYVYFDPLLKNNSAEEKIFTHLQEKVATIAGYIESHLTCHFHPGIIISTSFGCSLAYLVAEQLKKNNKETFLYLIDGATPALTKDYLLKHPESVENHIYTMAKNVIAPHVDVKKIQDINQTADYYKNLYCSYETTSHLTNALPNIFIKVLFTEKNIFNLGQSFCGWKQYTNTENIDQYTNTENIDNSGNYPNPLKDNTTAISKKIIEFINAQIDTEYLFAQRLKQLRSRLKKHLQNGDTTSASMSAMIFDACTALIEAEKTIKPSSPIEESPKFSKSSGHRETFFRRYHTVPRLELHNNSEQPSVKPGKVLA